VLTLLVVGRVEYGLVAKVAVMVVNSATKGEYWGGREVSEGQCSRM